MHCSKRTAMVVVAIFVLLCSVSLLAKDSSKLGIAETRTITFSAPTVIGGTLLPAGDYKVTHQMQGQDHIMTFTQIGGKKAEAKTKCTLVPLGAKAQTNEQHTTLNAKNERVLTEMTFRGDTSKHVLAQ
jgi:hypothetical protein